MNYLASHADQFGVLPDDIRHSIVTDQYASEDTGMVHIYLRQQFLKREVVSANINVNIMPDGRILSVGGGGFVRGLAALENTAAVASLQSPGLSAAQALVKAAARLGLTSVVATAVKSAAADAAATTVLDNNGLSLDPITAKLAYVGSAGKARLAWELVLRTPDGQHWYDVTVDGAGGDVLQVSDWMHEASYNVYALPVKSPNDGSATLVSNPSDPAASPYGWHDTNGVTGAEYTDTRGNNVSAQEDWNHNDTGGARPPGGTNLSFNYSLDTTSLLRSLPAAVTNLFYWNNLLHDIHYRYGFTEVAGNFQQKNYSGQGAAGDPVQADAVDGSGLNNANFGTPPDGSAPRMQMFLWNMSNPPRDGDFDNEIMIHEYGHGVSNRLVGGPSNVNALDGLQSGGMGEGWGDWWGLMLTQDAADTQNGNYPVGTYVLGQASTGAGIRRYPYSYNMSVDPLTYGSYNQSSEVHDAGEIWCSALWDMNWQLIAKHGYSSNIAAGYTGPTSAGNILALQLVMDSLKIMPVNPTFLQARDAVLQADQALTGGANQTEIWTAFARRGMGASAYDGGSADATTVVEAFDMPYPEPVVVSQNPQAPVPFSASSIELRFNKPMDPASFSVSDDVVSFTGPTGADLKSQITKATWLENNQRLHLDFNAQTAAGTYTLVVGPQILSADNHHAMDQDRDGRLGEVPDDRFTARIVLNSAVGPDAFGYRATLGTYENLNLVAGATGVVTLLNNTDDGTVSIPLGTNTLNFYGTSYTGSNKLYVSSNGILTFGGANSGAMNGDLTTQPTQPTISPLWDDWVTNVSASDQVLYKFDGNRLIVQWNQVSHFGGSPSPVTFQAILQLNTGVNPGDINFNYPDLDAGTVSLTNGASATVGIKDAGNQSTANRLLLVSLNNGTVIGSHTAIRISKTAVSLAPAVGKLGVTAAPAAKAVDQVLNASAVTALDLIAAAGDPQPGSSKSAAAKTAASVAAGPPQPVLNVLAEQRSSASAKPKAKAVDAALLRLR